MSSPAGLRDGLAAIDGVTLLGPGRDVATLPLATFTVAGVHHALVAARLSVEDGIGVRHGCFCAHPYLLRLLNLSAQQVAEYHAAVRAGDRRATPERFERAPGCPPRPPTSRSSSPPSAGSPPVSPRRSTINKTRTPGTTGRQATSLAGPRPTEHSAHPALAADPTGPPRAPIHAGGAQRPTRRCHHLDGDASSLGGVAEHSHRSSGRR